MIWHMASLYWHILYVCVCKPFFSLGIWWLRNAMINNERILIFNSVGVCMQSLGELIARFINDSPAGSSASTVAFKIEIRNNSCDFQHMRAALSSWGIWLNDFKRTTKERRFLHTLSIFQKEKRINFLIVERPFSLNYKKLSTIFCVSCPLNNL